MLPHVRGVDEAGRLAGIVSIHDIAVQSRGHKKAEVPAEAVLDTFIAITAPAGVPVTA